MKIEKIRIKNFKSIVDQTFKFENITTALIGPNGKGKTAFKEALYAGLTGEFPENCIRSSQETCTVEIYFPDGTWFARIQNRTKPNKVTLQGTASTVKAVNEIIAEKTGLTKDVLKIVTSTDVLQSLQPAEFGSFITSYIPEQLDYATVLGYISSIEKDAEDILQATLPPMPETFGIKKLTEAYDEFAEQRKLVKRDYKTLSGKVDSFKGTKPSRSMEEIEKELNETLRKDGAQESIRIAVKMYNTALENRKKAEDSLIALRDQINAIKATKPNPEDLVKIQNETKQTNEEIIKINAMISTIDANIKTFQNTLDNLDKPVCPISEKLICTTDKTSIKKELTELVLANTESKKMHEENLAKLNARVKVLETEEDAYRKNVSLYEKKTVLYLRYEEQKKSFPTLPDKPDETALVNYAPRIEELQKERDNANDYSQNEKDKAELSKIANKVTTYEFLCETLNAKGTVMNRITEYYMKLFTSICNETALNLRPGFEIKFISSAGVSYKVRTETGNEFTEFDALSSGEKLLTLFILVDMLSKLTSSKMMILDNLDSLDKNALHELMVLLQSPMIQSQYDHIILSAVNHTDVVEEFSKYTIDMVY